MASAFINSALADFNRLVSLFHLVKMESDVYSDIPSQYGVIPEVDNDVYNFFAASEENAATSLSSGNSFDEALVFYLSNIHK